jgi:phage shock protein A
MPLLERVTTLIRANLNDLVNKAENPEKLLEQLLLDMQNQFVQVKTQLAMAIADQHLLEKKQKEHVDAQRDWVNKAQLAMEKEDEPLARSALERFLSHENAASNYAQQVDDQAHQVKLLRDALHQLELKMFEGRTQAELLIAEHRRARTTLHASTSPASEVNRDAAMDRMRRKVAEAQALAHARTALNEPGLAQHFTALQRADQVERLLEELRTKRIAGKTANGA